MLPCPPPPKQVSILQLACDMASGLAYIHDKAVVHGDLSSSNVLLRREPGVAPLGARAKVRDARVCIPAAGSWSAQSLGEVLRFGVLALGGCLICGWLVWLVVAEFSGASR